MKDQYKKFLEDIGLEDLRLMAERVLTNSEIAISLSIDEKTFSKWRKKYPEFEEALTLGRGNADFKVVSALYKKAVGYNVSLKKTFKLKKIDYDPDTGKKVREYEELATGVDETHVPADLRAETFWLKNRRGDVWSDHPEKAFGEEDEETGGIVEIPEACNIDVD